jgi:NADPH-dependent glutamate synthase beta subunit-like oxidoreductase/formate hydrogenlyase subunit 6/NADH:ubiquinone oxidoreductase subunit I
MAVREKIVALAQKVAMSRKPFTEQDPEYYALECVVTDEQADLALQMDIRVPISPEKLSQKSGKSIEETTRILEELGVIGVVEATREHGELEYTLPIFVPGIMEFMVMNVKQVEKFPQIARAFERLSLQPLKGVTPMIPVGGGGLGMHVIPIEQAIPAETKTASYEQISHWLKKYDQIAVGSCSCRVTRRLMGEGCGHLEKDMCIALGDMAEFSVKTGRARSITYDECLEILKKAEDNGLVHQITNVDGPDKIFGICNCCRCSCFGLRTSQYFNTPNSSRSNFVAKIDAEKCVACGQCVEYCPANAVKLGQKIASKTPIVQPETILPDDHEWGREMWNPNFRDSKVNIVPTGTAPCKVNCPAHIAVQGYVKLAALGKYKEALELIRKENPLPAVCGRICNRRCEFECTRGDIDQPIAVDEIKKFIADQELDPATRFIPEKMHDYGKKMAIIGSGPAGLSCAYYLAIDGYDVTVFEKESHLGGMLTLGIPAFRLEKNVIEAEIDILKEMGVKFKAGVDVGRHVTIPELRAEGFEAFYVAIGAQGGRTLGIENEDAKGVISGVDFLRKINQGESTDISGRVVVIGGGNVAVDVARAAVRTDAASVAMSCLESAKEMPASVDEIEEATEEGITIHNSWGPKRIIAEGGTVKGVEFKKCTAVFDENGRFAPMYDEETTITVEADRVLVSIGQSILWGNLLVGLSVDLNGNGTAKADELTYQTGEADVYVGGDACTGPKFAIDAIAAGKQAAISLHRKVWPGQSLTIGRDRRVYKMLDKGDVVVDDYDHTPRQKPNRIPGDAKASFRDQRSTFTEEQMKKETERCLGCGVSIVDQNVCLGCGVCTTKCKFEAITLEKKFDGKMVPLEKAPETIMLYAAERQKKIAERLKREQSENQ